MAPPQVTSQFETMERLIRRRTRHLQFAAKTGELNIVPYLDIMVNLIMFMLVTITSSVSLSVLGVSAPRYTEATAPTSATPPADELQLTVLISLKGFYLSTRAQYVGADGNPLPKGSPRPETPTIEKKADEYEIVGLAKDAKYTSQRDEIPPTTYLPWQQQLRSVNTVTFEVRTTGVPTAAVASIRQAVREVDGNLPLKDIKTQIEQADETLAMERLFAKLLSLFGLLAQQLASIGLYGVLAWSVSQRTQEIGIRMALGADRKKLLQMIMKQGMTLTLIGVALGLGGAYVLTRYLESLTTMLYGVRPRDPLTFGVAAALLTLVALGACFIPARRATKVDPLVALRYE